MILGWSSFRVAQMVPVHCISRSQELKIDFLTKNLKNLLVRNHWTDFHITLQKCSFGDPLPSLFKPFGFIKKHGRQGAGLIFLIYIENFKNLLVRNHWTDFSIILQKCSFGDPLPRLFKPFGFVKKHGRQGAGLIFPVYLCRKLKKSSCQKPLDPFPYIFLQKCSFGDPLPRMFKPFGFVKKTWLPGGGAYFPYIIYIENLKNLLVRNHWTDFHILLQKCSFGDPLPRMFKPFGFVKKHGRQGVGLIFPIYLYRKLEKSSCQKPLDQFHYNLAKMLPWWPCTKIVQVIVIRQKTWLLGGGAYFPYISI